MSLAVECHECGSKQRFADADEGSMARCQRCGATLGVSRKSAKFVPAKTPAKKKKRKPNPAARLVDMDKHAVIRAGESGARMLLAALIANFAAFFLLAVAYLSLVAPIGGSLPIPSWVTPALGLFSNACIMAAMFRWWKSAVAIERGTVVKVGVVLGPILFAVELARVCGVRIEIVDWLSTYGRMVYFTLLVAYLERVCVLADRSDLLDLTHRVLSCGVGVIGIAITQQLIVIIGLFFLAPIMAMLSVAMTILWIVWCFEYFRLLLYAVKLRV
jgi:hypothetical protein